MRKWASRRSGWAAERIDMRAGVPTGGSAACQAGAVVGEGGNPGPQQWRDGARQRGRRRVRGGGRQVLGREDERVDDRGRAVAVVRLAAVEGVFDQGAEGGRGDVFADGPDRLVQGAADAQLLFVGGG